MGRALSFAGQEGLDGQNASFERSDGWGRGESAARWGNLSAAACRKNRFSPDPAGRKWTERCLGRENGPSAMGGATTGPPLHRMRGNDLCCLPSRGCAHIAAALRRGKGVDTRLQRGEMVSLQTKTAKVLVRLARGVPEGQGKLGLFCDCPHNWRRCRSRLLSREQMSRRSCREMDPNAGDRSVVCCAPGCSPGGGRSGEQRVKRADSAPCAQLDFGGGRGTGIGAHLMREELTKGGKGSGKMPARHRRRAPKKAVSEIRLATLPFCPFYRRGRASPVRGAAPSGEAARLLPFAAQQRTGASAIAPFLPMPGSGAKSAAAPAPIRPGFGWGAPGSWRSGRCRRCRRAPRSGSR